jgi:hypothetical protein
MNDAEKIAREIANEICNCTFSDPALPTWKAIVVKHLVPLVQERDELRADLDACREFLQLEPMQNVAEYLKFAIPNVEANAEVGRRWQHDSSLETWFPFTAKEITELRGQLEKAKEALIECEDEMEGDCRCCDLGVTCKYCGAKIRARKVIAELSAKDSMERANCFSHVIALGGEGKPPSAQAPKIPEPPPA